VGSCSEVSLPGKVSDQEIRSLNASIQAPSGLEEPCFLKKLPNGNLGISFTPREIGEHNVSVKRMGKHIQNSPFKIEVAEREVGDAKKVTVTGTALTEGETHIDNTFTVDTRNAGQKYIKYFKIKILKSNFKLRCLLIFFICFYVNIK